MEDKKQLRQLHNALKTKGLKLTPARKIILSILYAHKDILLNANEIFELVKQNRAKTNFSTIYRNLEMLVQSGIIEKVYYDGSTNYKVLTDGANLRQHHMICTLCHKTEPLPYCPIKELEAFIQKEDGFLPLDHKIEIYGHCKMCREENTQKSDIIRNITHY